MRNHPNGIRSISIFVLDLPFRTKFRHSAFERGSSDSVMLKMETESGVVGFGECLPRDYVTGESRLHVVDLLAADILPQLLGFRFDTIQDLLSFLRACNGKAPADWVPQSTPQSAAWAAVDLALLDTFGKSFGAPIRLDSAHGLPNFRFSAVCSADKWRKKVKTLVLCRLFGFRQVKIKIEPPTELKTIRLARRLLGKACEIRVDANMAWSVSEASTTMAGLSRYGVCSFEQPVKADDFEGLATLVRQTNAGVMVDESLNDAESLERLIRERACTSVNVRISKCGGLVAAYDRCRRALEAGLILQVGSQVGETSLLSAAQLILISAVRKITYAEGCFGRHLLLHDPVHPKLQFGYGGRPPAVPQSPGLGVEVDEAILRRFSRKVIEIK